MKTLKQVPRVYNYHPKTKKELLVIIKKRIKKEGNECDLNDIDVSEIDDMSELFYYPPLDRFNGDISNWDVSNVKDMSLMFADSPFNGDISKWNVSNVSDMRDMFYKSPLEKNPPKWYK